MNEIVQLQQALQALRDMGRDVVEALWLAEQAARKLEQAGNTWDADLIRRDAIAAIVGSGALPEPTGFLTALVATSSSGRETP